MSPVPQTRAEDCLQCAVATLLGVDRAAIPETDDPGMPWEDFVREVAERTGIELWSIKLEHGERPQGRWIAIVDVTRPRGTGQHAIVMNGGALEWDPEQRSPLPACPETINFAILAVPLDPRNGGSR